MNSVHYISWADNTGYATAAKAYLRSLRETGVLLQWTPLWPRWGGYRAVRWPRLNAPPEFADLIVQKGRCDTAVIHTPPEYYPHWRRKANAARVLGYTVWETNRLPRHWPSIINTLDGLIVPTEWNREVFKDSGVSVPIHVVPHLSQFEVFDSDERNDAQTGSRLRKSLGVASDAFVFYNIGDWNHRKGSELTLEAYWQAFSADDPVLLVLKTGASDFTRWRRPWRKAFRNSARSVAETVAGLKRRKGGRLAPVIILDEKMSIEEMRALHIMGDCYVSLTRAEGWGLGAFEAASLRKPVIMTGFGGQTAFLPKEHTYLVDYGLVPVHDTITNRSYTSDQRWAEPKIEHAVELMQRVTRNPREAAERGRRLAETLESEFSYESIMKSLMNVLSRP